MSRELVIPKKIFHPKNLEGFSLIDELDCESRYRGDFPFDGEVYHMMISLRDLGPSGESIYLIPVNKVIISEAEQDDIVVDEFIKHYNLHVKECGYRSFRT